MKIRKSSLALLTVAYAPIVLLPAKAAHAEPYGGCDEAWQAPHSQGAAECRQDGWIVRARFVVDPTRHIRYSSLPSCRFEDGSGQPIRNGNRNCSWNVRSTDGNGRGDAYLVVGWGKNRHFIDLAGRR